MDILISVFNNNNFYIYNLIGVFLCYLCFLFIMRNCAISLNGDIKLKSFFKSIIVIMIGFIPIMNYMFVIVFLFTVIYKNNLFNWFYK